MKETWNNLRKKYGVRVVIVLLSMLFLGTFVARKEGFHMDEILAFQLANAEYNPWIVPTQPVGRLAKFMAEHIDGESLGETVSNIGFIVKDTLTNRGGSILANYKADVYEAPVWIDREMMQNYVRCGTEDDYNLLSVYFNVKDDNHPPLHFMLLHLMTSVFKGEISAWHGCVINLAAMAGVLWILGLIGEMIFQKKSSTMALLLLAGFSMGMTATALWIRMYGLLTLWTVWLLYLHIRKYAGGGEADNAKRVRGQDSFCIINQKTGKAKWVGSIGLLILTVLSFWTQYFGLFFILPLAAVTVVLLWKDKRNRELWAYIRTMVTAAVIGLCGFPFAVSDVLFSDRGVEAISQWQKGFGEYLERLQAFGRILAENVVGNSWLFLLAVAVPAVVLILTGRKAAGKESNTAKPAWWPMLLVGIPTFVYFLLAAKMSPYYTDRYIMAIFPITALFIVWLWDMARASWAEQSVAGPLARIASEILCVAAAGLLVLGSQISMKGQHAYLYTGYEEQLQVARDYREYPVVCFYDGYGFYQNIMEMEQYARIMLVKPSELALMDEARTEVTREGYVVLIKEAGDGSGKTQLEQVMAVFGGTKAELLYIGGAFGDVIYFIS